MEITSLMQKFGLCFILVVVPLQPCMNVHKINPATVKACAALFIFYGLRMFESRCFTRQWFLLRLDLHRSTERAVPAAGIGRDFLSPFLIFPARLFPGISSAAQHHLQPSPAAGEQGARHRAQRLPLQEERWVSLKVIECRGNI